jgi:hypothetical protein
LLTKQSESEKRERHSHFVSNRSSRIPTF